ncbi:MAG: TonB family protein [Chitinophagaceae bacterium]|nr:TonB family protein [Chitinophagaceae bacterium]
MNLKIRLFLLCLLISKTALTQKAFYYSFEQLINQKEHDELPLPKLTNQEISTKMKSVVTYPRFAKSKNITNKVFVELALDDKGNVTNYHIENPGFLMFDTLVIKILQQIDMNWWPAKSHGIAQASKMTIPVDFNIVMSDDLTKEYFLVNVFPSKLTFVIDSSSSFSACMRIRDSVLMQDSITKKYKTIPKDRYITKSIQMQIPSMSSFVGSYGTVRLGFNVDKEGKISNIQIVHPVSKTMNDKALEELKLHEKNWLPAHEDGVPIDSYVEFDFKFNIDINTKTSTLLGSFRYGRTYTYQVEFEDIKQAYLLLEKEKYEKSLEKFKSIENLMLDDIEIKYRIAMIMIFLEKANEGCKKLDQIKSIAIDTGYPASVNAEMVEEAIGKYCQ